ncbi:MAG TPA: DinB family protein, partial [Acidimicrobiales bacterium]
QLEGWLDFHRATLVGKCAGLTEEQLTTAAVPPSELTLLGLLRHMALVEVCWFDMVLHDSDTPLPFTSDDDRDFEFHALKSATPEEALETFNAACQRSRELAAGLSLDILVKKSRRDGPLDLRWVYLHMIEEYARHNGHADLLREVIDGTTGI